MARALTDEERALLLHVLRGDAPGYGQLRQQAEVARYVAPYFEGSLSFDVLVPEDAPRAVIKDGPHGAAELSWADDGEPIGELSAWVEDGRLTALEYSWVSDEMPTTYPPLTSLGAPRDDQLGQVPPRMSPTVTWPLLSWAMRRLGHRG